MSVIHPEVETFRHHGNPVAVSTLDLLLTSGPAITGCWALDYEHSDHRPVVYEIEGIVPKPTSRKYCFPKADWKRYKEEIAQNIPDIIPLPGAGDIDAAISQLTSAISDAAERSIPTFIPKPNFMRKPPAHILRLIQSRNNIRNIFHRTADRSLKPAINALTRQIAALMGQWKTSLWHDQLRRCHGDTRQYWRLVRSKVAKRKSVLLSQGDRLLTPPEQAEVLADHYHTVDAARSTVPLRPAPIPRLPPDEIAFYSTFRQLESALRRTKGGKSAGPDNIPYVLLKMMPRKGKSFLLNIYNSSMRISYFPSKWKHAVVVPLLKPCKKGDLPEHYRPISLLDHMSKIFEKLLHAHITRHCTRNNIIPPEQTGFMTGVSCDHHVTKLLEQASTRMRTDEVTTFLSLDCTQAFDCVSHPLLLSRLRAYRFPKPLVDILEDYLRGRTFGIRIGDHVSTPRTTTCGVPQGSVLGPILFIIYTAHVVSLKFPRVQLAAYADDIGLYATSVRPRRSLELVEEASDQVVRALRNIGISVNPAKTDALVIGYSKRTSTLPWTFRISGEDQRMSTSVNYLGVHIQRHLSFTPHVRSRIKLAREKTYRLWHLLTTPNLSLRLKILIYKAIIRPTLLHGAANLRFLYPSIARKLQSFQNGVLRRIVRHTSLQRARNRVIHEELDIPTVGEFIRRRHVKFFDSLQHCPNPLFNGLSPPLRPGRWRRENARLVDLLDDDFRLL